MVTFAEIEVIIRMKGVTNDKTVKQLIKIDARETFGNST